MVVPGRASDGPVSAVGGKTPGRLSVYADAMRCPAPATRRPVLTSRVVVPGVPESRQSIRGASVPGRGCACYAMPETDIISRARSLDSCSAVPRIERL
eukprot:2233998-Rhodomonas_salina.5